MEEERRCLNCNEVLESVKGEKKVRSNKKFCNHRCCSSYYSNKKYHAELKNNLGYKLDSKIRLKKWIKKNRKHFNDLCRKSNLKYSRKIHLERKELGLCHSCGNEIDDIRWVQCSRCRELERIRKNKKIYGSLTGLYMSEKLSP